MQQSPQMAPQRKIKRMPSGVGVPGFEDIMDDIKALNSSILIISQKMKYVVRNEKILGRNLIVLNKKLKDIEERLAAGGISLPSAGGEGAEAPAEISGLAQKIEENSQRLEKLEIEFRAIKQLIKAINPLEIITRDELKAAMKKK